ncbi:MAG: diguanylate cyclase [Gammaproteobacteria bacterium]|nr:diguanylate cyclase [Gammaproteobacteria bacterium]
MDHVILLVDDLKTNVLLLERMLSGMGYRFVRADGGVRALELMESEPVSIVLLDVQMPDMDGFEVARRIRANPRIASTPIILVTGEADNEASVAGGYDAGAIDYLVKPVNETILRRKVQLLCALVEKERRIQEQLAEAGRRNQELEDLLERHRVLEEARMESEIRYRSLISLAPIPVIVLVGEKIVYYNAAAMHLLGIVTEGDVCAKPFHTFVRDADRDKIREQIAEISRRGGRSEPLVCQLATGAHVEINIGGMLFDDEVGVQMAIQDVTTHKQLQEELYRLSQMDGLTGVANRRSFNESLAAEWGRATRSGQSLAALMLDLDQFKAFNDHYGHLAGDECLKRAAGVMAEVAARPSDIVARYGGEDFCILLPDTDLEGACHQARAVVEGIRDLKILHEGNRGRDYASVSCGVAVMRPEYGQGTAESLIQAADEALYRQKDSGGDGYAVIPVAETPELLA